MEHLFLLLTSCILQCEYTLVNSNQRQHCYNIRTESVNIIICDSAVKNIRENNETASKEFGKICLYRVWVEIHTTRQFICSHKIKTRRSEERRISVYVVREEAFQT